MSERKDSPEPDLEPDKTSPDAGAAETESDAERRLAALLGDLETLRQYLDQRGRHTYELAQRFLANAARDPSSRQYDERQATMLEYQHYIWHEIAGRVAQLLDAYSDAPADAADESGAPDDARSR